MSVAVVTGSTGLIGAEAAAHFGGLGLDVVGIDNDMRSVFFGAEASTAWTRRRLEDRLGSAYRHHGVDIRDREAIDGLFRTYGAAIEVVVHTAAQPSHDWAARGPFTDFDINAVGTRSTAAIGSWHSTRSFAPPRCGGLQHRWRALQ